MSQSNPMGWIELNVQDIQRAKTFYESVLQIALSEIVIPDANSKCGAFPGHGGQSSSGALIQVAGATSGPGGTMIYFQCEDCAMAADRAAANGGSIHQAKMSFGEYGFVSLIKDTEGNLVGLFSNQ